MTMTLGISAQIDTHAERG